MFKEKENFELVKKEKNNITLMQKIIESKEGRIENEADFEDVIDIKKKARELRLKVEKLTEPFINIQKEALVKAKEEANKYLLPLKNIEGLARILIVDWEIKEEKRIADELLATQKKIDKQKTNEIESKKENQIPLSKSVGIRRFHKVKSVDIKKLPEEYIIKTADITKLNYIARKTKGTAKIPGVVFEYC